jgi:3-dehydroquinate dehydratase-2
MDQGWRKGRPFAIHRPLSVIFMKILIINGPNLNLLGTREPHIYGKRSFEEYFEELQQEFPGVVLHYFQSNSEGALIDKLHDAGTTYHGIVMNPGAYAHTSIALADAIAANTFSREEFRHKSLTAPYSVGCVIGLGLKGYSLAVEYFMS